MTGDGQSQDGQEWGVACDGGHGCQDGQGPSPALEDIARGEGQHTQERDNAADHQGAQREEYVDRRRAGAQAGGGRLAGVGYDRRLFGHR